jgi:glutamyl-tRNA reductase
LNLILTGISHKTAPLEMRERFAITKDRLPDALRMLQAQPELDEALILNTCNRIEFVLIAGERLEGMAGLRRFVKKFYGLNYDEFSHLFYVHQGYEALRHVFQVASGLDSMVVGEPQILGQVKMAYSQATQAGTAAGALHSICHRTFSVAKRVRTETRISEAGVSVVSAAVEMAERFLGTLIGKSVLIVGAGEVGKHAARHLISRGASPVLVSSRTHSRAVEVAEEFKGLAVRFDRIWDAMRPIDVVISSTGCPHFLFTRADVDALMHDRNGRPLFLVDLAVPRDIDPEIRAVQGCQLVSIEDLERRAENNAVKRANEMEAAGRIIDEELARFRQREDALSAVPTIVSLRRYAEEIRRLEIDRTRKLFGKLTPEQEQALEVLTQGLVNKLLHSPLAGLKQAAARPDRLEFLDVVRTIFQLDAPPYLDSTTSPSN